MLLGQMPTIGENIRTLRVAAGFRTQGAFAKALDLPQPRLSDLENDRYQGPPELPTLLLVAKKLRVDLNRIVRGFDTAYDEVVNPDTKPTSLDVKAARDQSEPATDDGEEMAPAHPADRLAAVASAILEVGQELRAWRPPTVARRSRSEVSPRTRKHGPKSRRKPATKATEK
jgi:transcriptional regulator with XRE-family HTH domain